MSGRQGLSSASAQQRVTPDAARLQRSAGDLGSGLRLPAFVGVATTLAVAAHALADRMLPDARMLALSVAGVTLLGLALRGRERSFEAITAGLLGCQVLVHVVLCLGPSGHTPAAAGTHAGHLATGPAGLLALYPGHTMLVAHLLAAGVAGWWLRKGEEQVWAAVGWAWPALTGALPAPVLPVTPRPAARRFADAVVHVLRDRLDADRVHPRRGPPAVAALASAA